jgi:type III pantothenate kinase
MKRLLFDLGNTRIKWAVADQRRIVAQGAFASDAAAIDAALNEALTNSADVEEIWLAAVADAALVARLRVALANALARCVCHEATASAELAGVRSAYHEPERLGVDRLLALVGAHSRGATPALVAGIGTALALDVIDAGGNHLGGLIAPAPELMRAAVLRNTARVAPRTPGARATLGRTTEDALDAGCWLAAAALIERALDLARATLAVEPAVLLHGGAAGALLPLLRIEARLVPELVFDGLLEVAHRARR